MAKVTPDFWRHKRVFLTGHTGFKGSWLSLWLTSMGAQVSGLALEPPTSPNLFDIADVGARMTSTIGDIRDYDTVQKAMSACKPDIIIHMAAQPLVRYSYQQPVETYLTNVMGTVHVLEAARQIGTAQAIVNVTTDKCYDNKEWVWGYRENDPMGGFDPYSSSKGCAELVTAAYRNSFFDGADIALASARAGNVIGGGDWADDRLVPDILRAFEKNEPCVIRNPLATRPWQHVLEPLCGYLVLAEHLYNDGRSYAEGWNFGPLKNDVRPVSWIVEKMAERWGNSASWEPDTSQTPYEAKYLMLDIAKASTLLGWTPQWDLETSLDLIVQWHQSWLKEDNMQNICLQQISMYTRSH